MACAQDLQQQCFEQGLRFAELIVGSGLTVAGEAVQCVGGYWQPQYSVPNARMVEAVQALARTESILLDPVYTGKIMAGLIGLARQGRWARGQRVLFLHTGGMPSLFAYHRVVLGQDDVAP